MLLNLSCDQALVLAKFADCLWHESDDVPDEWLGWFDVKVVDGLFDRETTLYRLLPEHKSLAELALIYLGQHTPSFCGMAVERRTWSAICSLPTKAHSLSIERGVHWLWEQAKLSSVTLSNQYGCTRLALQRPTLAIARINEKEGGIMPKHAEQAWLMITSDEIYPQISSKAWAELVVWG